MTDEELLADLEDLLRTMPPMETRRHETPDNLSWLGRAAAILSEWDLSSMIFGRTYLSDIQSPVSERSSRGFRNLTVLLNQARAELRMKTVGPTNVAISSGMVFEYFDEIRKVIEGANSNIFFVDPYLDPDFVSSYLSHIKTDVQIRLLAREKIRTLIPAAKAFVNQNQVRLEIRSAPNFHDRFVFIDERDCYQSGASFKDGAKKAPTTITQITDAFAAVFQIYQDIWKNANVEL